MGAGMEMDFGDIAFKCNFATLDPATNIVISRRADRNFEDIGPQFCQLLDGLVIPAYPEFTANFKYATEHRCGVRIRGPGLSDRISGTDPLKDGLELQSCRALDQSAEAVRTSAYLNALSLEISHTLQNHTINAQRSKSGKPIANVILFRGCGTRLNVSSLAVKYPEIFPRPDDRAFAIAPTCMINGWMKTVGVDCLERGLEAATGDYHTDIDLKGRCAFDILYNRLPHTSPFRSLPFLNARYQFGFLHVKAVDDAGHDGNLDMKISFIERIDTMLGTFVKSFFELNDRTPEDDTLIVITGDHSTPVYAGDHSCEPVPFLIFPLHHVQL
eukprot:Partr_v1_DN27468_c5_g1_i4_m72248 putative 2,3bisphosphoglycerate-in-dependent phosphoglycerate